MHLLPIDSYPGYVLDPIPSVKGVRIQERESVFGILCTLGAPSWGTFGGVTLLCGAQVSLLWCCPLFSGLNASLF